MKKKSALLFCLLFCSCISKENIRYDNYPSNRDYNYRNRLAGKIGSGTGINIKLTNRDKSKKSKKASAKEKKTLFSKAMAMVSSYLPLEIVDEKNGRVASEWGMMEGYGVEEVFKITVLITSDNEVHVSIFKKIKLGNDWVVAGNDEVKAEELKVQMLKNI